MLLCQASIRLCKRKLTVLHKFMLITLNILYYIYILGVMQ